MISIVYFILPVVTFAALGYAVVQAIPATIAEGVVSAVNWMIEKVEAGIRKLTDMVNVLLRGINAISNNSVTQWAGVGGDILTEITPPDLGRLVNEYEGAASRLADPIRIFKGNIIAAPITTPAEGGEATCEITVVSAAWALTRSLTLKRSHAALTARNPGDGFRRYGDTLGAVDTAWGERIGKPVPVFAGGGALKGFRGLQNQDSGR